MEIKPLRPDLSTYIRKHNLTKAFSKQIKLFLENPHHPSLHTERLEPKDLKIYSLRITRNYRAIFILIKPNQAEIIDINNHYR